MKTCKMALVFIVTVSAVLAMGGCSASPIGAAISLAGMAVNDLDVQSKSKELMGVSVAQCDQTLGTPINVFRSEQPVREWRVYSVPNDLLGKYRYLAEIAGGNVIAFSKAQTSSDIAVDIATKAYFDSKCKGKSVQACQDAVGNPPALSVRNVKTNQLVQLYDARLVQGVQKPYYAVLFFGTDEICAEIKVAQIPASTKDNPTAR